MSRLVMFFGVFLLILDLFHGGQCASTGSSVTSTSSAVSGSEPQVAVLCESGASYHPQYLSAGGRWQADLTTKPQACVKDKMEILDYCKKMYPNRDITNIVEASHYVKVSNWCKIGSSNAAKCKLSRWVKPFRCLEGPFQSDALLVPESCLFDHIHNQSRCWQFGRWNATAGRACAQRGLRLRTFAMLLPCGISLFSGVEFVCCPKHFKENVKMHKPLDAGVPVSAGSEDMLSAAAAMDERDDALLDDEDDDDDDVLNLNDEDDDDDAADDDTDIDEDEDVDVSREDEAAADADADAESDPDDDYTDTDDADWPKSETASTASTTTTAQPSSSTTTQSTPATSDPYFSHFDPRTEHQSYKDAQQRLEETHREKITKVMKDWSNLEERYQEMMETDPQGAQTFRQRMTAKFQAQVQNLEEAGVSERRRLAALHQQRVLAHLAQRRRAALACYTRSLQDIPPNTHRVQKCLQRLVRALGAERAGALAAWRRAAAAGKEAAAAERGRARDRLQDADRALQRALAALRRKPHLYEKIGTAIEDYVQSMQSKDDMAVSLMSMTAEAEELLLDRVANEVQRKQQARETLQLQQRTKKEHRTKQRNELQQERMRVSAVLNVKESDERDDEASEQSTPSAAQTTPATPASTAAPASTTPQPTYTPQSSSRAEEQDTSTAKFSSEPVLNDWNSGSTAGAVTVDSAALQAALEQAEARDPPPPPPAHALRHDISHGQPGFSIRGVHAEQGGASPLYPALCVGAAALAGAAAVALAVSRRRRNSTHGFVQVEQTAGVVVPTPEERHVANMQINGYENPTYKYFEVKE